MRRRVRQFLDDEAELSEEDGPVSSDEEDNEEQNQMLEGFVVDNSHLSQGLNGMDTVCHCGLNTLICHSAHPIRMGSLWSEKFKQY